MIWNARSLGNNKIEFFNFLWAKKIDIAFISEIWLKNDSAFANPIMIDYRGCDISLDIKNAFDYNSEKY